MSATLRCTLVLVALWALGASLASAQPVIIVGATLIDGTGAPPREGVTIVLDGDRIATVTTATVFPAAHATVLDARGKYVIPGLVDLHVHFSLGAPLPRRPHETEVVLARALYYGVTSILQLGASDGSAEAILRLRRRREAGELDAPAIYGTGGHLTLPGTHPVYTIFPPPLRQRADSILAATPVDEPADLFELGIGISFVRGPEAARQAVRQRATAGMEAIKITVESGPTPYGDDHPQMSVELVRAIVGEAEAHGLPVFAHVSSLDELETALDGGASGAVHAARNLPLPDERTARRMVESGFWMLPTLSLYAEPPSLEDPFLLETVTRVEIEALEDPSFLGRVSRRWECCAPFEELLESIGMLHREGVHLALGTDTGNPYVFPGYSVHRELELLVRAGLTPMEALEAATRRAAEMIGRQDELGTVVPGKRADLLILGEDPLEDITHTRSIEAVVSSGRLIDRSALRARAR